MKIFMKTLQQLLMKKKAIEHKNDEKSKKLY